MLKERNYVYEWQFEIYENIIDPHKDRKCVWVSVCVKIHSEEVKT